MLVEVSLTCMFHHVWENVLIVVFTFLENALNLCIFIIPSSPLKTQGRNVLKIPFPIDKRGVKTCDLFYQNSIKKYEDDLEH